MLSTHPRQSNLFYVVSLNHRTSLHKDRLLGPIDRILEDPELLRIIEDCLAQRSKNSRHLGRPSTPPVCVLRSLVLKHIKGWSFRSLSTEVESSLIYRRFTRFDEDRIPTHSTFSRLFALVTPDALKQIHARVFQLARGQGLVVGQDFRTDTTVVETNIHYPTDSSLLEDSIRVVTRTMEDLNIKHPRLVGGVVNHRRSVGRNASIIKHAGRLKNKERADRRRRRAYRRLLRIAKRCHGRARKVLARLMESRYTTGAQKKIAKLQHYLELMGQVIQQTEERIFGGNTRPKGKIVSIFEPHTQVIRKGKLRKPTEFGRMVRVDGCDGGMISGYQVLERGMTDVQSWKPALENHVEVFERPPHTATGDAGFYSAANEKVAREMGVKRVALRKKGKLGEERKALQKKRWFRRSQRWHTGIEAEISILKHAFSMERARYRGECGLERHIGGCVLAHNLVAMARLTIRQKQKEEEKDAA